MNWRKSIGRAVKWIVLAVCITVLLLALMFGLAQTRWGKGHIAEFLAWVMSGPGTEVYVGRLDGLIPFDISLDRLTISDEGGQWLSVEGLRLQWLPVPLIYGRVHMVELVAGVVQLDRLPSERVDKGERRIEIPTWPSRLPFIEIERLAVDRMITGEAILGEEGVFTIRGHQVADPDPVVGLSALLSIDRIDKATESALVEATVRGDPPILSLRLDIKEAEGGWLASALGLAETAPLDISLQGQGPISSWHGRFTSRAGQLDLVRADILVSIRENVHLITEGTIGFPAPMIPAEIRPLLSEENRFELSLESKDGWGIAVDGLKLDTGRAAFGCTGLLDMAKQQLEADINLQVEDMSPLQPVVGTELEGHFVLEGQVSGPFSRPEAELSISLARARLAEVRAGQIQGDVQLALLESAVRESSGLRMAGIGTIEELTLDNGRPFPERRVTWSFDAEIQSYRALTIRRIQLTGESLAASVAGRVNLADLSAQFDSTLRVQDLERLLGPRWTGVSGSTGLQAKIRKEGGDGPLTADIEGRISDLGPTSPALGALLGAEITYEAGLELAASEKLTVSGVRFEALGAHLIGEVSIDLPNADLSGQWRLNVPELGLLSSAPGHDLGGSLQLDGEIQGSAPAFGLSIIAQGEDLIVKDIPFKNLNANLRAEGQMDNAVGHLQLAVEQTDEPLDVSADFKLKDQRLKFEAFSLDGLAMKGGGNLQIDLEDGRLEGRFECKSEDLQELSGIPGVELGGRAKLEVHFTPSEQGQDMVLTLNTDDLSTPYGHVGEGRLRSVLQNALDEPRGVIEAAVQNWKRGDLKFDALDINGEGDIRHVNFKTRARGRLAQKVIMEAQGDYKSHEQLAIRRLQGSYGEKPIELTQPLIINFISGGIEFDSLALSFGPGYINGSGRFQNDGLNASVGFEGVPLAALPLKGVFMLGGQAAGRVHVWGPPEEPEASAELDLSEFKIDTFLLQDLPPGTLGVESTIKGGILRSNIVVDGLTERPWTASLEIPMKLSLLPYSLLFPRQEVLNGQVRGEVNLARISKLLQLADHRFEGKLQVEGFVSGQAGDPEIRALSRLESGFYENLITGTILRDIEVELSAKERRLIIERARATDGEEGKLRAQGWLDLVPERDFPFEVKVDLENATLLRADEVAGPTSGSLRLSGSLGDPVLQGELTVAPTEIQIPEHLASEIEESDSLEVGEKEGDVQE